MNKYIFLILVFLSTILTAKETIPKLTSEHDTLALVEGVVNTYNGKLVLIDQDIAIQGQDPLEMTRYYDGGHHYTSEFGYGIGCSYPAFLYFDYDTDNVKLELRQGSEVLFEMKKDKTSSKGKYTGEISKLMYKSGYTNCCEALLKGDPSIYAMKVIVYSNSAVLDMGNGTKRHYRLNGYYPGGSSYLLWLEEKGNGNRCHYSYTNYSNVYQLARIATLNRDESLTLNWLNFENTPNNTVVRGSNGQFAHYLKDTETANVKYKKKGIIRRSTIKGGPSQQLLKNATVDHYPAVQYESLANAHSFATAFSISKVKKANGQFLSVEYDNHERVKKLFTSGVAEPLYTFDYHLGYTWATDIKGSRKIFEFDNRRLKKLSNGVNVQTFDWDEKGQLISHKIHTPANLLLSKRTYTYDDRGNILEISTSGCFTKKESQDVSKTSYTYSADKNLLLSEKYNSDLEYAYSYHPGLTLIASKLTIASGKIQEREFYEYDKNAILIRKIVDDGSKAERDDFEEVTYRFITEIEPHLNPNLPGMTLPHFTSEFYQDLNTGEKKLLKRLEHLYTQGDLLAEKKVFDATDTYMYSLFYEYNSRRELISETDAFGHKTIYAYDDLGNKIYEEKLNSKKRTTYVYDKANCLIEVIEDHDTNITLKTSHTYDAMGNRLSTTNHFGQITNCQYDAACREVAIVDDYGNTERKEYDAQNNVIKTIDKDGYVVEAVYNIFKKPLQIIYHDGSAKRFHYNLQGYLIQKWERDGTSEAYDVDYKGRTKLTRYYGSDSSLLKETTKVYKGPNLVSETDAMGNVTRYEYDGAGRKIVKLEDGRSTFYEYDSLGRLTKTKTSESVEVKIYDFLDRIVEERTEDLVGVVYAKTEYVYDIHGNKTVEKKYTNSDHFSETKTIFNSQSQPVLVIDALGNQKTFIYHYTDHLEKEMIDALGRKEFEYYDRVDRLFARLKFSADGQLLSQSGFAYDGRGNKIFQNDKIVCETQDFGTHDLSTTFDGFSQKISETEQSEKTTSYSYVNGKLHQITKPDGVTLSHIYDAFGRLKELSSSDKTIHYCYTYDLNDNLIKTEDLVQNSATERSYDHLNRLIREKQATGFEIHYVYDSLDRIKEVEFRDEKISYSYCPTGVISATRYKNNELLNTFTQQTDWRGNVTTQNLPGNLSISYGWDGLGRCVAVQSVPFQQSFVYNQVNNLISTQVKDSIGSYEALFSYNDLDQITEEKGPFNNQYSFDSLDNQRNKNGATCSVNGLNQLISAADELYSYDKNGNRTSKDQTIYSYDALNRLVSITNNGNTIRYQYDSFGRRIGRSSINEMVQYLYQFDTEIAAIDKGTVIELRAIYDQFAAFAIELNGQIYSPIRNHRGDICSLIDNQGNTVSAYRYDAFGQFLHEGTINSPWMFSGQRYDDETNLYSFLKRDYDPVTGRWLTPDLLGFADGPNLYAYVHNNPLIYVDPYGLLSEAASRSLNIRLQGFCQVFGGAAEMSLGGAITFGSSGMAAPVGAVVIVHGADQFVKGAKMIFTGSHADTLTSQMLQKTGMSSQTADTIDNCISMAGSFKGAQVLAANAVPNFKLPQMGNLSKESLTLNRGADNINGGIHLTRKLKELQHYQNSAHKTKILPDGRIRYKTIEVLAENPGPTSGGCRVLEWNPIKGRVRTWYECHDHFGNINRVHPKTINGQKVNLPHYPPIGRELTK